MLPRILSRLIIWSRQRSSQASTAFLRSHNLLAPPRCCKLCTPSNYLSSRQTSLLEYARGLPLDMTTPKGNPLPAIVHATLREEQIGRGRIIVVGDIHGCSEEFSDLLQKCGLQHGVDVLVSVGDLVGKGPNHAQVLVTARELGMITVRGNWDEMAAAALRQPPSERLEKWRWLEELSTEDVTYLQQMPFSLSIPSHGCVVTHAGMVPGTPLNEQQLFDLIEMRHVDLVDPPRGIEALSASKRWKALPKYPRQAGEPWATVWPGPDHVIFGHHARRRLQACSFASGIDTGCCLGDKLTALVLPPLSELRARNWTPPVTGVTREDLGAQLVAVSARQQYVDEKD